MNAYPNMKMPSRQQTISMRNMARCSSSNRTSPSGEMLARLKRTSMAFDAIVSHVDAVDAHLDNDYVLLTRPCKPSNGLFHSPCEEKDEDDDRTIRTTSPILANAAELDLSFRHTYRPEVLIRSPILANSYELLLRRQSMGRRERTLRKHIIEGFNKAYTVPTQHLTLQPHTVVLAPKVRAHSIDLNSVGAADNKQLTPRGTRRA